VSYSLFSAFGVGAQFNVSPYTI